MEEILNATSLTDRTKLESGFGTCYSALASLPYFDTICISTIDPMHNLLLGNFLILKIICFPLIFFIQN